MDDCRCERGRGGSPGGRRGGVHAKAGGPSGIGAHTISYENYARVSLIGRTVSEGEIFATAAEAATRAIRANTIAVIDVSPPFQMEVELREPLK